MVEAVAVVVETGFGIVVLCRETMAKEVGERTGLGDKFSEGVVGIGGNGFACGIEVAGNVTVVVVERDVDCVIDRKVEVSTNSACALQRAGEVLAPEVADRRCGAVRVGNALLFEVPVVIEEGCRGIRGDLANAAGLRIVEIRQSKDAVCQYGLEAAGGIVGKCANVVCQQIPVKVVCEFSVLVDVVWRIRCGVADFIVAVAARNSGNIRRRHFAAVVVAEGVGIAADGAVERIVGVGERFDRRARGGIDYVRDERAPVGIA